MSIVQHESQHQKPSWRFFPNGSAYPTPKSITHSPPLVINHQRRYFDTKNVYSPHGNIPPPTDRGKVQGRHVHMHPTDRKQPEQQRNYISLRSFEIVAPSGTKRMMVLVERVSHITAQVEYGLVPADPKLRRYDETGNLVGNERMELLSPTVFEDTVRGTFFFAERRPVVPTTPSRSKEVKGQQEKEQKKMDDNEQILKKGDCKGKKDGEDTLNKANERKKGIHLETIPTLLEQLIKLKVLAIIPNVRCKSIEHKGACLVRILLKDYEVSFSFSHRVFTEMRC